MRRLNLQHEVAAGSRHPVDAAEEAPRGRPESAFTIAVIDAAVTGAHEQARLLEPLHRAAQVGTVDSQDQEPVTLRLVRLPFVPALVANIDAGVSHHAVP